MTPLLELRNVAKRYGGGLLGGRETTAVEDLSLKIAAAPPSITAVAGESGSGKTTLARLLLGFVRPSRGEVLYRGRDLAGMTKQERRRFRREVQPIFQDPYEVFNPFYRVDHVLETPVARFGLAASRQEARRLVGEALEMVGLRPAETLGRFPHQLSGGQRQRIMVARALLLEPQLILADEPVSMVDASLRATILGSLRKLNRELGISVVYITHDLTTAYQISENIAVMYRGSIVEAGPVERVIGDPLHPYTQLLVGSIPVPDPGRRWSDSTLELRKEEGSELAGAGRSSAGCRFADRCPAAMEACWNEVPPHYRTKGRAAACFLFRDDPVLESGVASLFEASDG